MFEEAIAYVLSIVIGLPVIAIAVIRGEDFGTATTICLGMCVLGVTGLVRLHRRRMGQA